MIRGGRIIVKRGDQQFGPFTSDEVTQYLRSGNLILNDLAQVENSDIWRPLSIVLGIPPSPVKPTFYVPWYRRTGWQVALLLVVPYVQVPMMWFLNLYSIRTRLVLSLTACLWFVMSLIIGFAEPHKIRSSEHSVAVEEDSRILPAKNLERGLFGNPEFTKAEWRSKIPNNQTAALTGQIICSKAALFHVVGEPDQTESFGDDIYLYWTCSDGVIQLVCYANAYNAGAGIVGKLNDY